MKTRARERAEEAAFQCFLNSYLREIDQGEVLSADRYPAVIYDAAQEVRELILHCRSFSCLVEVAYRSQSGRHRLGAVWRKEETGWQRVEKITLLIALIEELHCRNKDCSHYEQLLSRVLESTDAIERYVGFHEDNRQNEATFIDSEQSLVFGHWMHPTPKSRYGMAHWQHDLFAPELKGRFQLHLFYANPSWVRSNAAERLSAEGMVNDLFPERNGYCTVPMHPLQAKWLLQQPWVAKAIQNGDLLYEGALGPLFTATSSVRTVYSEDCRWMFKFSLPVHITNSLRVNKRHELECGIVMGSLMGNLAVAEQYPSFRLIEDPAYVTVDPPGLGQKESGFEVIIRENPFMRSRADNLFSVAALVQEHPAGKDAVLTAEVKRLAEESGLDVEEAALRWFRRYWETAINPLLTIYDRYGIALEAHQQNSVLQLENGWPSQYYYRDNQGFYLCESYRVQLQEAEPALCEHDALFYKEPLIRDRFFYYVFFNQLFSITHRMGADGLIEEKQLLRWMVLQLSDMEKSMTGAGRTFIRQILTQKTIACKANLMTRFQDVDELEENLEQAVYTDVPNPLTDSSLLQQGEGQYEPVFL